MEAEKIAKQNFDPLTFTCLPYPETNGKSPWKQAETPKRKGSSSTPSVSYAMLVSGRDIPSFFGPGVVI